MKIDKEKFLKRLDLLGLGTGTLAARAGVPPDYVQKVLALEEIDDSDYGKALLEVIGEEVLDKPELTVKDTIEKIEAGELDPQVVYEQEMERDKPRITLLNYLKENANVT